MNRLKLTTLSLTATALVCGALVAQAADVAQRGHELGYTKERFHRADANSDGFLTREEAASRLKRFEGVQGGKRFYATDTDGDGLLSLAEAAQRKQNEQAHGGRYARGKQNEHYSSARFDQADTDGDGFISWAEAVANRTAVDKLGRQRFNMADANSDGKLSFEEAKAQVTKERAAY